MRTYNSAAVALALNISECAIEDKKNLTIADILVLSENKKLKKYDEEAAIIRKLINDIKALEK